MKSIRIASRLLCLAAVALLGSVMGAANADTTRPTSATRVAPSGVHPVVPSAMPRQTIGGQPVTAAAFKPVYSLTPRPSTFVLNQAISFDGKVEHLQPGTNVHIISVSAAAGSCPFGMPTGAVLPTATVAANGIFTYTLKGWFLSVLGSPDFTSCSLKVKFSDTGDGGVPLDDNMTFNFSPTARETHTVTDTGDLSAMFGFALVDSHGTCDGTSRGGAGDQPVGMRIIGGDIEFNIRSGPAGTQCAWLSKASLLANGVVLTEVQVESTTDPQCNGLTTKSFAKWFEPYGLPTEWGALSLTDPARGAKGVAAGGNPNGLGAPVGVLGGTSIRLGCEMTLTNDKRIHFKINTMTFKGPPGFHVP